MQRKQPISYKEFPMIQHSQTLKNEQILSCEYSPFTRQLPTIMQNLISPYERLMDSQLYQQNDHLKDEKVFGVLPEDSFEGLKLSGESNLLQPREKLLLIKVYQKEKELVLLEQKIHILRNSNQCLRETIYEEKMERNKLFSEFLELEAENSKLKLTLKQLTARVQKSKLQTRRQSFDQQGFFQQNHIPSKPHKQIIDENLLLQHELHKVKALYEQQIQKISQNNQNTMLKLNLQVEIQKKENQRLSIQNSVLQTKIQKLKAEKKEILTFYLEAIEQIKQQFRKQFQVKKITTFQPSLTEQKIQMNEENSFNELHKEPKYASPQVDQHQNHFNAHINSEQIKQIQTQNQLLKELLTQKIEKDSLSKSKNSKKCSHKHDEKGKSFSQDKQDHLSNQNCSIQSSNQINKNGSIPSLRKDVDFQIQPYQSIPYFYKNQYYCFSYDRRSNLTYKSQISKQKNFNKLYQRNQGNVSQIKINKCIIPKAPVKKTPLNLLVAQNRAQRHNKKMYWQIDRKLNEIKSQLMKEISY